MRIDERRPGERAPTVDANPTDRPRQESGASPPRVRRWFCSCQTPHVLLGTCDRSGRIHLKARDRYWHVVGSVLAICPRCGCEYALDPNADDRATVVLTPDSPR